MALTAPVKQGFNWAGYFAPGLAMATGGVVLTMLIRKWGAEGRATNALRAANALADASSGVSDDDLARLARELREDN